MIARVICIASIVTLGAMGIDAQMAPAHADSPPVLKVESSCEAAGRGAVVLGRNKEACLADETTAQDTLKQNWSKYSAADKTQCVGMTKNGGPASYVELLSCLEIMRDARNIRNADPVEADNELHQQQASPRAQVRRNATQRAPRVASDRRTHHGNSLPPSGAFAEGRGAVLWQVNVPVAPPT